MTFERRLINLIEECEVVAVSEASVEYKYNRLNMLLRRNDDLFDVGFVKSFETESPDKQKYVEGWMKQLSKIKNDCCSVEEERAKYAFEDIAKQITDQP